MKITVEYMPSIGSVIVKIDCPEEWLQNNCEPLPMEMFELITIKGGIGIIEDAFIMAMGCKRKSVNEKRFI